MVTGDGSAGEWSYLYNPRTIDELTQGGQITVSEVWDAAEQDFDTIHRCLRRRRLRQTEPASGERKPGRLYFSTATPSASAKTMAPGRILAPPISTLTSVSPAPSFALLRGLLANALIPKSISAKASRSRTAPLMTTPDHPLRTADSAIISPIRAVAIEPSPSMTSTAPSPG